MYIISFDEMRYNATGGSELLGNVQDVSYFIVFLWSLREFAATFIYFSKVKQSYDYSVIYFVLLYMYILKVFIICDMQIKPTFETIFEVQYDFWCNSILMK